MKIVFDTNVLFSAFTAHGVCAGLYEEYLQQAQIVVSPQILAELEKKLRTKARLTIEETFEVIAAIRADAELVTASPLAESVCRYADDDWILAAALTATADAIVTGDQDLLVLQAFQGIPILNPRDCLALLAGS